MCIIVFSYPILGVMKNRKFRQEVFSRGYCTKVIVPIDRKQLSVISDVSRNIHFLFGSVYRSLLNISALIDY